MQYKLLSNGVKIPRLGYGTLKIPKDMIQNCIIEALNAGYRLIDTAASYFNENEIGKAIKKSNVPRQDIFITTKVWVQDTGYEKTLQAFETSLKNLGLDYIDLYLIHQPYGDYYGSWRAMEELYHKGKIRAIGVCNFSMERFMDLYMNCSVKPMINQIEYHPFFSQNEAKEFLHSCHCQLEAWGPLNEGQRDIFNHKVLQEIAKKYKKTISQVVLRWHIQQDIIAIPKTNHQERMVENMNIWDFELSQNDMKKITELDKGHSEIINHQCYLTAKALNKCKIHD